VNLIDALNVDESRSQRTLEEVSVGHQTQNCQALGLDVPDRLLALAIE